MSHGTRRNDVQIGVNLAPFMIHELFPCPTETASGSHPCRVVSVTYHRPSYFHGGNTGSNAVGDANHSKGVGVFYGLSILPYRTMGTRWKTQSYRGYTYAIPTTGQSRRECPSSLNRGVKDCHKPSLIVWGSTAK